MSADFKPVLCGGMFMCILLEFKARRYGEKINEPEILADLISLIKPSFKAPTRGKTFSNNAALYKSCDLASNTYLPFDDEDLIADFDKRVREKFHEPLAQMDQLIRRKLDYRDPVRTKKMVGSLIGLLENDKTIKNSDSFVFGNGNFTITKKELLEKNKIPLHYLLLSLWHFIVTKRKDNKIGRETFLKTHIPTGKKGSTLKFVTTAFYKKLDESYIIQLLEKNDIHFEQNPENEIKNVLVNKDEIKRYLKAVENKYSKLKTLVYSEEPHQFKDIYVCNSVMLSNVLRQNGRGLKISTHDYDENQLFVSVKDKMLAAEEYNSRFLVKNPTVMSLLDRFRNFIIIAGTGGLGKSMMLRHLLLDAVENYKSYGLIPLFIPLNDYSTSYEGFLNFVYKHFSTYCDININDFKTLLLNGNILFLFDGMDEIKGKELPVFEKEIEGFTDKYSTNVFIMSSRPSFSRFLSYDKFSIVNLCPLEKDQAVELISRLDLGEEEKPIKEKFISEINASLYDTHEDFVTNPLLLTIMFITYEQYGEISSKMHLFYRDAFMALAQKHDATKGGYRREYKTKLSPDELSDYFAEFCMRSYYNEQLDFTPESIKNYFNGMNIVKKNPNISFTYQDFIDDLTDGLCLMYYEGGEYHFSHRSFQEYFCAYYFSKQKDKTLGIVGDFFEKKESRIGDLTFLMLYQMIPEKVVEYILVPFLKNLLEECDRGNGYETFLRKIYPIIFYSNGKVLDCTPTLPCSFLFPYIQGLADLDRINFICDLLPDNDDYEIGRYAYMILKSLDEGDNTETTQLMDISNLVDDDGNIADEDIVPDGRSFKFSTDELFDLHRDNKEFIDALSKPGFPLYDEYIAIREWLANYNKKESKPQDNFFDNFE